MPTKKIHIPTVSVPGEANERDVWHIYNRKEYTPFLLYTTMDSESKIKELEDELNAIKEELQLTNDELQTTKEHLKKYTAPSRKDGDL